MNIYSTGSYKTTVTLTR